MKLSKSKQVLADAIHASGKGWPDGANWAAQDKIGMNAEGVEIAFHVNKPVRRERHDYMWNAKTPRALVIDSRPCDKLLPNWHQAVLSREEYYQAYPKADADGWIEHDGTHVPSVAASGAAIWCKWSDGLEQIHESDTIDWIDDSEIRVVAYRLHKPEVEPVADADGWIEWKGGDCPVDGRSLVNYKMRDGDTCEDGEEASNLAWEHRLGSYDIIAYRLHKPEVKPEFCESVMRSIPEPELKPSIEQLAQDYRNAKDYADRLKSEATNATLKAESIRIQAMNLIFELIESLK